MTQWISSILHPSGPQPPLAVLKSDGLLLQVFKLHWTRRLPPYLLTLDLRPRGCEGLIRVVEIRGDTPQACATLLTQLVAVAKQALAGS